ncbi:copper transport protein [Streptomyces sp. CG 926]|uniref:copper resistance CopC/CopD family protein n=1 Tax=Streptomyces sp. CG 926 TaxID=1882405 RepID=UPI000D6D7183|nr:copper resistance protein CopC [Streptomyces sp. CG 926]PWK65078.1 copper transport protein [Streptomyces sp. CG 926]
MRPVLSPARTSLTVLALLAAVFALLVGGAGSASAHASLSGSDPADSSVLKEAPRQVTLTFTESVTFSEDSVRVLSPENQRVNPAPAEHVDGKGNTARVQLSDGLSEGTYTVAWRVVSADGHPISGAFVFSIGKPSDTAAVVPDGSLDDSAVGRLYGLFRYVAYSGLGLLVGAAAFVAVCWSDAGAVRGVRRMLASGWIVLGASTVALLLLRGPYETAGGLTSVFDLSQLGRTAAGRPGLALIVRLVLLAAAAVLLKWCAVRMRSQGDGAEPRGIGTRVRWTGVVLAVALAFTWAAAEHASAGIQVPLAMPVAVLHLLAMGVWLGGLITLVIVLRCAGSGGGVVPASVVGRFSTLAFAAVAVLVGTGVYQSWRQVGSWGALTTTSYGKTLVVKVAVVVLVLWVASFSRRWTARFLHETAPAVETRTVREPELVEATVGAPAAPAARAATDQGGVPDAPGGGEVPDVDAHRRRLRRTVAVEAVLGVVVLALSTLLTGTQPSRAEGEIAAAVAAAAQEPQAKVATVPFDMGKPGHQGKVQVTLAPGRVGENTVEAVVFSADGGLASVPELRLSLTQEKLGIGPIDAKLKDQKGFWAVYDLQLPMPGEWTLNITVRTSEIDQVTVRGSVDITPVPGRPAK